MIWAFFKPSYLYRENLNLLFELIYSSFSVQIQFEDWDNFNNFVLSAFVNEKTIEDYQHVFHWYILGNPENSNLQDMSKIDKSINYYSKDKG